MDSEYLGSLTSEEAYNLHPEIVEEQLTPVQLTSTLEYD
jgi:anthranilate phosphoribosyltransferase